MRKTGMIAAAVATLLLAQPARADTVADWWDFANRISGPSQGSPGRTPEQDRAVTRAALAMFEAVNAIDRRYQSYLEFPGRRRCGLAGRGGGDRRLSGPRPDLSGAKGGARRKLRDRHGGDPRPGPPRGRPADRRGGGDGGARRRRHRSGDRANPLSAAHRGRRVDRRHAAADRALYVRLPALGDRQRRGAAAAAAARADQPDLGARL